jgi:hypothetical protein
MRLWLNEYELNSPENRVYVDVPLEGLEKPSVRTSRGTNTGQTGGYISAQLYDVRSVSILGRVFSPDINEALEKRREIQSYLKLHPEFIVVRILDDDGSQYTFNAYFVDFKMPIERGRMMSKFKLELEAPDPVIYDDAAGAALSATVNQIIPGGFQFTDTSPQFDDFYFSAGSDATTVENTSEVTSLPIITITGQITNPIFTNRTTGESFRLEDYSVDSSAVTVINMAERTVTLNGGNVFAYAPVDVDWFGLVPGENRIEFTSGSGGDVTTATISWRPGYWGI